MSEVFGGEISTETHERPSDRSVLRSIVTRLRQSRQFGEVVDPPGGAPAYQPAAMLL